MRGIRVIGAPPAEWLKKADAATAELRVANAIQIRSNDYSLQLAGGLTNAAGIPANGNSLLVIAEVSGKLSVRAFDSTGNVVAVVEQPKRVLAGSPFAELAAILENNWDQSKLKKLELEALFPLCEVIIRGHLVSEVIDKRAGLWTNDAVRDWLLGLFNRKCWYTEAQDAVSSCHVDHYRPKGRVSDDVTDNVSDGYWWLAFKWSNYRICGQLLNVKKKDVFPHLDNIRATHDDSVKIEKESPLLIDPYSEEDARLISYEWQDEESCLAVATADIAKSDLDRVTRTIEILGLNRLPGLNAKRAQLWKECRMLIADFKSASDGTNTAKLLQGIAKATLKRKIDYEAEFSSVAEACIFKEAPPHLSKLVYAK